MVYPNLYNNTMDNEKYSWETLSDDAADDRSIGRKVTVKNTVAQAVPTTLYDENGNAIHSHQAADGTYDLGVNAIISGYENPDRHLFISNDSLLAVTTMVRLVGSNFNGGTKDPNIWTETITNGGSLVQDGKITLNTNTTANGTAKYVTTRKGRFVMGAPNKFLCFAVFVTAPIANNVRRHGVYDTNDGYFFQVSGTAFSLGTRKNASNTLVANGTFNGNLGATWSPTTGQLFKFEIEYGEFGVYFYVNDSLLHKIVQTASIIPTLVNELTLPITIENNNINGNTTNSILNVDGSAILRQGQLHTNPITKYVAGAATTVLKYNAGVLHSIINNDNTGSCIVYDNTVGSGTIIASLDFIKVLGSLQFDAPFSTGLTVVTTGMVKLTFVYE